MAISTTGSYLSRRVFQDICITVTNNFTLVFIFVLFILETASGFKSAIGIPVSGEVGTRSACEMSWKQVLVLITNCTMKRYRKISIKSSEIVFSTWFIHRGKEVSS